MTPTQVALVQQSWAAISPPTESFALLFQQRLARTAPGARRALERATRNRAPLLLALFDTAVATLDLVDNLTPALRAIGQRLRREGIGPAELKLASDALLWTILRALGDSPVETRKAWEEALETLSGVVVKDARPAQPALYIVKDQLPAAQGMH